MLTRKIGTLVALCALAFAAAACGGPGDPPQGTENKWDVMKWDEGSWE